MKKLLDVNVAEDELAILWLGQNSFFLKTASGRIISIDPYFSRTLPPEDYVHPDPPIRLDSDTALAELAAVDYVVCTHDHLDHTDSDTLAPFAKASPTALFVGPPESYDHFLKIGIEPSRAIKIELGEEITLDGIRVKAAYSEPTDRRDDDPSSGTTHFGYVFSFGAFKLYHSGDTRVGVDGYARNSSPPRKVRTLGFGTAMECGGRAQRRHRFGSKPPGASHARALRHPKRCRTTFATALQKRPTGSYRLTQRKPG